MAGHFLQNADAVFGVGCSFTTTIFGAPIPSGKTIIHLTNNEADINKDVAADVAIVGDAKLALRQLIEEIRRQGGRQVKSPVPLVSVRRPQQDAVEARPLGLVGVARVVRGAAKAAEP